MVGEECGNWVMGQHSGEYIAVGLGRLQGKVFLRLTDAVYPEDHILTLSLGKEAAPERSSLLGEDSCKRWLSHLWNQGPQSMAKQRVDLGGRPRLGRLAGRIDPIHFPANSRV